MHSPETKMKLSSSASKCCNIKSNTDPGVWVWVLFKIIDSGGVCISHKFKKNSPDDHY